VAGPSSQAKETDVVKAIITFEASDPERLQQALGAAAPGLVGANGYRGMELRRGVEKPNRFLLFVDWDAVADHMAWMAANEKAFLGAIDDFISAPPDIKHYQQV
jgi:heme-degrading monooxygenase HmoA